MLIGVMSDTHGHLTEMRKAASRMLNEFGVDVIIHLGDDSTDVDELASADTDVIWVPGVFEDRYRDKEVPRRIIRKFEGVPFLITHTPVRNSHDSPDDIDPTAVVQDGEAKVVLYGHTHIFNMEERYGAVYINPGHLKPKDDRGYQLTFAILDIAPTKLDAKIINLEGEIMKEKTFFIDQNSS